MTDPEAHEQTSDAAIRGYRVLARKYRPANFADLIGQQSMVRTLGNSIRLGRIAHAFILTGVRGVGKTTTARIIARVLNCTGNDGEPGPTLEPCGKCPHCMAIADDSHMDVIETDAASRTGVSDMRDLIDGMLYRPVSARYKVYIIDEIHMLSMAAFNALLKTLEEPPEHVKFIFATTEIRKVPVTVLSRCQRFDLRRVDADVLGSHFRKIADMEDVRISDAALRLISRAADGSVRDGLSLLDQAIVLADKTDQSADIDEKQVRSMLGLADRGQTFALLESVLKGDIPAALDLLGKLYEFGADPVQVTEDMLELTHWLTRLKIDSGIADDPGVPEMERVRGRDLTGRLSMAALARAWQMLLKGLGEIRIAPSPLAAAEMVMVRLAYVADLPSPAEAVRNLSRDSAADNPPPASVTPPVPVQSASPKPVSSVGRQEPDPPCAAIIGGDAISVAEPDRYPVSEVPGEPVNELPAPASFKEIIDLSDRLRAAILHANLINNVHLVHFEPGRIEFRPGDHAPAGLAHDLSKFLNDNTARRWVVTVSCEPGEATINQQKEAETARRHAKVADLPLVKEILKTFPGAKIKKVTPGNSQEQQGLTK